MICTPRRFNQELDPSASKFVLVREFVRKGDRPTLYRTPSFFKQVLFRLADHVTSRHVYTRSESSHNSRVRVPSVCNFDALLLYLASEHRTKRDITYTLDFRHARVELVVDHDAPARIDFDADLFEIEAFYVWPAADGDEHGIRLEFLVS